LSNSKIGKSVGGLFKEEAGRETFVKLLGRGITREATAVSISAIGANFGGQALGRRYR